MTMNTKMIGWNIPSSVPPFFLGYQGENNASIVSIEIEEDEVVDAEQFPDVKYYLDIHDDIDGETPIPTTQELNLNVITEQTLVVDDEGNPVIDDVTGEPVVEEEVKTYFLVMKPLKEWLGKSNTKSLQVRLEYTDTTDTENPISIVIKSNVFYGIVK